MKGLKHMADLMAAAPNSTAAKRRWLTAAQLACKSVAEDLGLEPGTFEVRTCEGGSAVPDEVILHGESLYLCIGTSKPGGKLVGYARSCEGRKDYTGGANRWLSIWMSFDKVVQVCREAMAARGEA